VEGIELRGAIMRDQQMTKVGYMLHHVFFWHCLVKGGLCMHMVWLRCRHSGHLPLSRGPPGSLYTP
jgi:hypothetical protein